MAEAVEFDVHFSAPGRTKALIDSISGTALAESALIVIGDPSREPEDVLELNGLPLPD